MHKPELKIPNLLPDVLRPGDRCVRAIAACGAAAITYAGLRPEQKGPARNAFSAATAWGVASLVDRALYNSLQRKRRNWHS